MADLLSDKDQQLEFEPRSSVKPPPPAKAPVYSYDGIWTSFNRFIGTGVLLFMAALNFNLVGFFYFALFILHTYAYYSFKVITQPVDYVLAGNSLGYRMNIRLLFSSCFMIVSIGMLIIVVALKVSLHLSGQDTNPFDDSTDAKSTKFQLIAHLIPNFDSIYTLLTVFMSVIFALLFNLTLDWEDYELQERDAQFKREFAHFAQLNEGQSTETASLGPKAKELLQDYNFRQRALFAVSFALLGAIAASTVTTINAFYVGVFLFQGLCISLNFEKLHHLLVGAVNKLLLLALTSELLYQYLFYISHPPAENSLKSKYLREVTGLLLNQTSFAIFVLKTALFVVEAYRHQFSVHLTTLKTSDYIKAMIDKVLHTHSNSLNSLIVPVSHFLFCTLAVLFVLLHPSALYAPFLPLLMLAFFFHPGPENRYYSLVSKIFLLVSTLYVAALFAYQLYSLHAEDSLLAKWRMSQIDQKYAYVINITGLRKNSLSMRQFFPSSGEFLIYLLLVSFAAFSRPLKQQPLDPLEELYTPRESYIPRDSEITDLDTNRARLISNLDSESRTLRDKCMAYVRQGYRFLMKVFKKMTNLITIHSAKFALLVLFSVTAFQPNIVNAVLFVMFLMLAMSNNTQMLLYWKVTLSLVCAMITGQYYIRIFTAKETLERLKQVKTGKLCLSGLVQCQSEVQKEMQLSLLYTNSELQTLSLYLPYVMLLLTLIVAYFILVSRNYQTLMDYYIDQEVKLQKALKKHTKMHGGSFLEEDRPFDMSASAQKREALEESIDDPKRNSLSERSRANEAKAVADSVMRQQLKDSIVMVDPVTRVFVKNALYLLLGTMGFVISTLPVSLTNIVLLFFMTAIVIKALLYKSQITLYQNSTILLRSLNIVTVIAIFTRYWAQFYVSVDQQMNPEQTRNDRFIAIILGHKIDMFAVRLLSLTLILVITRIQLIMVNNQALIDILKEEESEWNKTVKLSYLQKLIHATSYVLYQILPTFIIGTIFLYSVLRPSLLGLLGQLLAFIVLRVYEDTFWKEVYVVIGVATQLTIVATYLVNSSVYILAKYFTELDLSPRYNFIYNAALENLEIINDDKKFFTTCLWLFSILAICFVSKILQINAQLFQLSRQESLTPSQLDNNDSDELRSTSRHRKLADAIFDFDQPIRTGEWVRQSCKNFVFSHGVTVTQILLVAAMMVKLNINSLVYLYYFYCIYRIEYYPSRFEHKQAQLETIKKRQILSLTLNSLIFWTSILILTDYMVFVFHSFSKGISLDDESTKARFLSLWENTIKKLCYADELPGKMGCVTDWNNWLSVSHGGTDKKDFLFQFSLLLCCYYTKYFVTHDPADSEIDLLPEPSLGDKQDFTRFADSNSDEGKSATIIELVWDSFIFEFFPYFLVVAMFIALTHFNNSSFSDMIAVGYLIHAIYFVAHFRSFYTKNTSLLQNLRVYNLLVLVLYIAFQAPVFLCPGVPQNYPDAQKGAYKYVPVEQCANLLTYRDHDHDQESWHSFYFVVAQSIGLRKFEQTKVPYSFIAIILITELQSWAFAHPYFQAYVLANMQHEKLDGKMRGFMHVEKFHLNRKWAYKQIRAQISILHNRLLRIQKDCYGLIEQEQPDVPNENTNLIENETQAVESSDSPQVVEVDEEKARRIRRIDQLMNRQDMQEMLEEIATSLLRPNFPVVSLKKLKFAVREEIIQRQQLLFPNQLADGSPDPEDVKEVVFSLVRQGKLQREEYKKNRLDLYHKEGIGLSFAIKRGCEQNLDQGDYNFYYNLFIPQYDCGTEIFSSNSMYESSELLPPVQPEAYPRKLSQQPDQLLDFYSELQETIEALRKAEAEETPLSQKISIWFRQFLLQNCDNRLTFYSLYNSKGILLTEGGINKVPLHTLIQACLLSHVENICFAMMFLNFAYSANLISLVLPISVLFYGLLENPKPSNRYWRFVTIYLVCTIAFKFFYQLPIICSSPEFAIWSCNDVEISREVLVRRIDYIIGLQKFNGGASYPRNIGIFKGVIFDIVLLVMLVYLKSYLVKTGQWHFVQTDDDIHSTPRYKCAFEDLTEQEKTREQARQDFFKNEYQTYTNSRKAVYQLKRLQERVTGFIVRLLPRYMDKNQANHDIRTQQDHPTTEFKHNKVKPGQDYFNGNFFTLLALMLYTLVFYRSFTGQLSIDKMESLALLDHFSSSQVYLLFLLLLLMMIERMLYRTRKTQHRPEGASWVSNDWAQHTLTIKLAIYAVLVVVVHVQCGFYFPINQGIKLNNNLSLLVYYMLWILHLVYAGLQIKHGYPQQPYKHTFMRDTSFGVVMLFRLYKAVPFLWEMKVIIDWTVTNTCLDLFQWFRLDDAFNYVYYNKQQSDYRRSRPEYEPRDFFEKFTQGFCFAFSLILLILAPVLLFSGINPIKIDNPVKQGFISMKFELNESGNEYNIFAAQAFNIRALSNPEKEQFKSFFIPTDPELNLDNLQRLQFTPYSESNWLISSPSLRKLAHDFEMFSQQPESTFKLTSTWEFTRGFPANNERTKGKHETVLDIQQFAPFIDLILSSPDATETQATVRVKDVFPKMLKLSQSTSTADLEVFSKDAAFAAQNFNTAIDLTLFKPKDGQMYWTFSMPDRDPTSLFREEDLSIEYESNEPAAIKQDLVMVVFNETVLSSFFAGAMSMSVIGIYVTIVYAVGNFLRIIFDRYSERVIYEELPNTEKLFEICEGIFIAQLEGDMKTEKRLYDLLIMVYRSPELMIKMTGTRLTHVPEISNGTNQRQD